MGERHRVLWVVEAYDKSDPCWVPQAMWVHWTRDAARAELRSLRRAMPRIKYRVRKYVPAAGRGE